MELQYNHPLTELIWMLGGYQAPHPYVPRTYIPYVPHNKQYYCEQMCGMDKEQKLWYLKDMLLHQRAYSSDIRWLIRRFEK